MAKIHDWTRVYWRNASGSREYFDRTDVEELDDEQEEQYEELVSENDRALYINEQGDIVGYRVTEGMETDHGQKYEVYLRMADGEPQVLEDVTIEDDPREWVSDDEEDGRSAEVEVAAFSTRGDAREFAAAWRDEFGSPEQLGHFNFDPDDLPEDYDEIQDLAQEYGLRANAGKEQLVAWLTGEEEPEFVNGHVKAPAQ